jgi:hypothetical protein
MRVNQGSGRIFAACHWQGSVLNERPMNACCCKALVDTLYNFHHGMTCPGERLLASVISPDSTTADASPFAFAEKLPDVTSSEAPATAATK